MPDSLTADRIRRRLAGTRMPADPLAVDFTHMGNPMPAAMVTRLRPSLRAAGVLIPIVTRGATPSVLLTERSAELKHHAGQVSFPGGGMESHDTDIVATALRETHEEVGIQPSEVDIAGYLDPVATITGYAVTCVVGLVEPTFQLVPDPVEVDEIFEVPLEFLMDRRNAEMTEREYEGSRFQVATFHYDGHRIWGATAGMLVALSELLITSR
jgi:8-oxo-dGTP pyrophosphatase MutT (NUDIX family)